MAYRSSNSVELNREVALPLVPSDNIYVNEPSPPPQEPPLLDVHPIHAPVRVWRDFFIHIVIIVVGLCIAVGIQQTVEFFHNHYQRDEMRRALRLERETTTKRSPRTPLPGAGEPRGSPKFNSLKPLLPGFICVVLCYEPLRWSG